MGTTASRTAANRILIVLEVSVLALIVGLDAPVAAAPTTGSASSAAQEALPTLVPDVPVTDSIGALGEVDRYTFTLPTPERVVLLATGAAGVIDPCLRLVVAVGGPPVPGGTACSITARVDLMLPAGTYFVEVSDLFDNQTGPYTLLYQPVVVATAAVLTPDIAVTSSISPRGDLDLYTFTLAAAERVVLQATGAAAVLDPCVRLLTTVSGPPVAGGTACGITARLDLTLAAGTYYVETTDNFHNQSGPYSLLYQALTLSSATPITAGIPITDTIAPLGDLDLYTFALTTSERVVVRATGAAAVLDPCIRVLTELSAPPVTGGTACGLAAQVDVTLPPGTYLVEVSDSFNNQSGPYVLSYQPGVSTPPTPLPLDTPHAIAIVDGAQLAFDITVSGGAANLFVRLQKDSFWRGTVTLFLGSTNVATTSGMTDHLLQIPAPAAGTYRLTITGTGAGTGLLTASTALPALTLGQPTVGTMRRQWGNAWYQVDVPANQQQLSFAAEMLGAASRIDVWYASVGGTPRWAASGDRSNLRIPTPVAGRYYVQLYDSGTIVGPSQVRDHRILADAVDLQSPPCTRVTVASFSPARAGTGPVTVTVNGTCFVQGAHVRLWSTTAFDYFIDPESVLTSSDGRSLHAAFDLSGVIPGEYTLVAGNPGEPVENASVRLVVEDSHQHSLEVTVLGRSVIRAGRDTRFTVRVVNRGNVDALGVPLWVAGIPRDAVLTLGFTVTPPPALEPLTGADYSQVPVHVQTASELVIPLFVFVVPAGGSREFTFALRVPTVREFFLRAWVNPPFVEPPSQEPVGNSLSSLAKAPVVWPTRQQTIDCVVELGENAVEALIGRLGPGPCAQSVMERWASLHTLAIEAGTRGEAVVGSLNHYLVEVVQSFLICLEVVLPAARIPAAVVTIIERLMTAEGIVQACREVFTAFADFMTEAIRAVMSISPEDKYGAPGYDTPETAAPALRRWVASSRPLPYRIDFWNREDAPAPTQDVIVADALDADLDWNSFAFTEFGFLRWKVRLEPTQYFNVDVDVRPDFNLMVNVEGVFDPATGQIEWRFRSLDPVTREPPEDPFAGFLPPITNTGYEIGWVDFLVSPRAGLLTGTEITNQSFVKFDVDVFKPAPPGGPFLNTLDADAPASAVLPLGAVQNVTGFRVEWGGADVGAGVRDYTVSVSTNQGAYVVWRQDTTATSAVFPGQRDSQYAFRAIARDHVGNTEPAKTSADTTTLVAADAVLDRDLDGMTDDWESQYGLDPLSDVGNDGPDGDPDEDGVPNAAEYAGQTDPTLPNVVTLAEGATGSFFEERIALANPGTIPARVTVSYLQPAATPIEATYDIAPQQRLTVVVNDVPGLASADVSAVVRATRGGVAVERTMTWDRVRRYGGHTGKAVRTPRTEWYLAEGEASFFDTYILFTNANQAAATVTATYLLGDGSTIGRTYTVSPNARLTVRTNDDSALSGRPFSTTVTSTVPIIVDRAMYFSTGGVPYSGGHASSAVEQPSSTWFVAEGATGAFFDEFLLLANPNPAPAIATVRYLTTSGAVITRSYDLPATSRTTIYVDGVPGLENVDGVSAAIAATAPIIVERAMYWPAFPWTEAHNSAGVTTTGTRWVLAEGEAGGPLAYATYILLANPGPAPATTTLTFLRTGRPPITTTFTVPANSRVTRAASEFPLEPGEQFGMLIDSTEPIVVERAMYWNGGGLFWGAGTNETAIRLRP